MHFDSSKINDDYKSKCSLYIENQKNKVNELIEYLETSEQQHKENPNNFLKNLKILSQNHNNGIIVDLNSSKENINNSSETISQLNNEIKNFLEQKELDKNKIKFRKYKKLI
ncbi:hypothetical protein [Columbia Basin potato purple top phytoplasma]|uniref:Uncharacterized protein n=1 Tax=Columbia Basin potato purple top phytoplasma TaxID=307134 RepID=A0ABT5L9F7_9MOLU|nr:hypothetical protein [Columbia Basin potato purple top phytoplasma]MDC9032234.1 hypothetical protein [Columbia Basin potato purple top phytoplasma]